MARSLTSLLLLLFCGSLLASAGVLDHLIDTVFATHQFKEVAISADGSEVAWVEQWPLNDLRYQNHIFIAASKSGVPIPVKAASSEDDHGLTWSPDGEHLAFLGEETTQGEFQLHVFDLRTKEVKVVGPIGDLSTPRWSPKGDEIAVLLKASPQPAENVVGLWIHRDTVPRNPGACQSSNWRASAYRPCRSQRVRI